MMTARMLTQDDPSARNRFQTHPMAADRDSAIHTESATCALTPDIRPPRTARQGPQHAALLPAGTVPSRLRCDPEFPMHLVAIAMLAQSAHVFVGHAEFADPFAGAR